MNFCDFIRQQRELMGLSQKNLAEALSVDVSMYSRYERGQRPLKEEYISLIASKLNVDGTLLRKIRKMWIADNVLTVVNAEKDVTDILNIVAENINNSIVNV